jgi:aspartate carbamoyltransferase catalytic subunit
MEKITTKHLLGLENTSKDDIEKIIDVGFTFREVLDRPIKKVPVLNGKNIVNLFFENSTRTKISFELAEKRLSADITNFSSSSSSVQKGESLKDTIQNIHIMKMDCVVMRHPIPGSCYQLSNYVDAVIINAGDGTHEHPTQALLDMMSIKEKFGKIKGLNIGIIGDILHSRVALSNIFGLIKLGAKVKVCAPPHLLHRNIEKLKVSVTHDVDELIEWADAINILRIQKERMGIGIIPSIREYRKFYGITKERLSNHKKEIVIMHPGPINRGVEIDSEVADSDQAIILDQVLNGVAVRMSALYLLLGNNEFDN